LLELAERGKIQDLISIFESTFAYSLDNGAFGVYFGKKKLWKAKNKDKVTSICTVSNPI
jgi:hypothetical protein